MSNEDDESTLLGELRASVERFVWKLHENINYQAFLMGVAFVGLLAFSAKYIETRAEILQLETFYIPLFTSIFIGSSFGHYLGLAVTQEQYDQAPLDSLALGAFLALSGLSLYFYTSSPLMMALVLSGVVMLLGHTSRLIENHQEIEMLMERFAERVSPIGLGVVAFIKFGVPFIVSIRIPLPHLTLWEMGLGIGLLIGLGLIMNVFKPENDQKR